MLYPVLEERLHHTRRALDEAISDNIIERCKQYLALLAEYRSELHKLPATPGINLQPESSSSREDVDNTRKPIRAAIVEMTQEHNRTEALLHSFTVVSGYEAVETLNRRKYTGHSSWTLRAGGVRFSGGTEAEIMTIHEAVDTTSLLRREEHIALSVL